MFPKLIQIDMNKNKIIPTNMTNTSNKHHHLLALKKKVHLIPNLYCYPMIRALALYIFKQIKFYKNIFSWEYATILTF